MHGEQDDQTESHTPESDGDDATQLPWEECAVGAHEPSVFMSSHQRIGPEEAKSKQTPHSAEEVHWSSIQNVVDFQLLEQQGRSDVDRACNATNDAEGAPRLNSVAAACDCHEATEDTVENTGEVSVAHKQGADSVHQSTCYRSENSVDEAQ